MAKPSNHAAGAGDAAADPRRRQLRQEQREGIKPHLKGHHSRAIRLRTRKSMPREILGEIPRATLRRQNPGAIAAAVAGRRTRCRNHRR
jgi:hypothetical protein